MTSDGSNPPSGPAGPEETDAYGHAYDDALSRLFDGLDLPTGDGGAEGEQAAAQARAGADVALISRALRLIGAEAAGDDLPGADDADRDVTEDTVVGPGAGPAARAEVDARVLPLRPVPPPGDPVEIEDAPAPARRRLPSSGVLAAAASLVLVVAVGVAGANKWGGGGGDGNAAVQQPAHAAAGGQADALSGQSAGTANDQFGSGAPPAGDAAAGADAAAAPAAAAPAAGAASAPTPTKASKAARASAAMPLAQAVACARAVLVGEVVAVADAKLPYRSRWTLHVTEWVRPTSGPAEVTYVVGGPRASLAGGGLGTLPPGQKGLFLVPADKDAPLRAWTGLDEGPGRQKVDAAQAKGWSGGC
jgi:hypothetical protein